MRKIILLADMEAFYASVEMTRNPSLKGKPVIVCGDPMKRHGIALAASRGYTSLFRASSLADGGQLFDRANKIGGHEA